MLARCRREEVFSKAAILILITGKPEGAVLKFATLPWVAARDEEPKQHELLPWRWVFTSFVNTSTVGDAFEQGLSQALTISPVDMANS